MTLAAGVYAATGEATKGKMLSHCLMDLVNMLIGKGWVVFAGSYNNVGTQTAWGGATNNWNTVAKISIVVGHKCWIVLKNTENHYVLINLITWTDAAGGTVTIAMSYTAPTISGTTDTLPTSIDWVWGSASETTALLTYTAATDTRMVIWADGTSFFATDVKSGQSQAGTNLFCLKIAKADAADLYPYCIGGGNAFSTPLTDMFKTSSIGSRTVVAMMVKKNALDASPRYLGHFCYPSKIGIGGAGTPYACNDNRSIVSNVAGELPEWEIQVALGTTANFTESGIWSRRGVLSDIRWCWTAGVAANADGTTNTGSTRICISEWSLPWNVALTWPT